MKDKYKNKKQLIDELEKSRIRISELEVYVVECRKSEQKLAEYRDRLRDLYNHAQTTREEARKFLARAVHDELGQAMTALKVNMSNLYDHLPKTDHWSRSKLKSMIKITDGAVEGVHRIVAELGPQMLEDLGLEASIEWQSKRFQKSTGIKTIARVDCPGIDSINLHTSVALFRTLQESLSNVYRHAHATRVQVLVTKIQNNIVMTITDNGIGIEPEQIADPKSFGLFGMKERILDSNGNIEISGQPNKGTTIKVTVPLEEQK